MDLDLLQIIAQIIFLAAYFTVIIPLALQKSKSSAVRGFVVVYIFTITALSGQLLFSFGNYFDSVKQKTAGDIVMFFGACMTVPLSVYMIWFYTGRYRLYSNKPLRIVFLLFYSAVQIVKTVHSLNNMIHPVDTYDGQNPGALDIAYIFVTYSLLGYMLFTIVRSTYFQLKGGVAISRVQSKYFLMYILSLFLFLSIDFYKSITGINIFLTIVCVLLFTIYITAFYYPVYEMTPLTAAKILRQLDRPLYVADKENKVLFKNNKAKEHSYFSRHIGESTRTFFIGKKAVARSEKQMPSGQKIISFFDVTEYHDLVKFLNEQNENLKELNRELDRQNEELRDYASRAEEFAANYQRRTIMGRLNSEVNEVIAAIRDNTLKALESDNPQELIRQNIELSSKSIEIVRSIIREMKEMHDV